MASKLSHRLLRLDTDPEKSGRHISEDGSIINLADDVQKSPINIARGLWPEARPIAAFGERTTSGLETNTPIAPQDMTQIAQPGGEQMLVQSTSPDDAVGGTGIQYITISYLDARREPVRLSIPLEGVTPVSLPVDDVLFIENMWASGATDQGGYAAGVITAENAAGSVFAEIEPGFPVGTSCFRMVPRGMRLFIDGAVGSSLSPSAPASTLMRLVANKVDGSRFEYPLVWIPFASIGMVNSSIPFSFPPQFPFEEGTVVGIEHTSDKTAILSASWFGRLEPVQ